MSKKCGATHEVIAFPWNGHQSLADYVKHQGMEVPPGIRNYTKMLTLSIPAHEEPPNEIRALTERCVSEHICTTVGDGDILMFVYKPTRKAEMEFVRTFNLKGESLRKFQSEMKGGIAKGIQ